MAWIQTESEIELPTPVENKRKGMAMEAGVTELIEKAEGSETSLDEVLEKAGEFLIDVSISDSFVENPVIRIVDNTRG